MAHKYAVGDKVRILDASEIYNCTVKSGDITEVIRIDKYGDPVLQNANGDELGLFRRELKYIELANAKPTKGKRIKALEGEVEALKKRILALEKGAIPNNEESREYIAKAMSDALKRHIATPKLTTNQRRKALIDEAKAWLDEELPKLCYSMETPTTNSVGYIEIDFYANKEKRVVTAVPHYAWTGGDVEPHKAIVKCSPDDVYNEHIGKLIAAHRVLGLEVPRKFTHAVQPDELVEGHDTAHKDGFHIGKVTRLDGGKAWTGSTYWNLETVRKGHSGCVIINDTEAVYE